MPLLANPDAGRGKNFCDRLEQNAFAVFDNPEGFLSLAANRSCTPTIAPPISRWLDFIMPRFVAAPVNRNKFFIFFANPSFPE